MRGGFWGVLERVENLGTGLMIYEKQRFVTAEAPAGLGFDFSEMGGVEVERVVVRFETPTELKAEGVVVEKPEFGVLVSRLRDRISNLRLCYQGGGLDVDFEAVGRAAGRVRVVRSSLRRVEVERQSSRTGQRHSIGGVVGEVEYEGELGGLMVYLKVGEWVGVGRQTVWGKGMFAVG